MLESRFVWVLVAIGAVVGLFAGGAASGRALDYLAWRNATPFNITDPRFGLDVGFFVFAYPWWRFVLSFIFAALVFSAIVAAIVHYTMGGLRFSGPRRGGSRATQAHLSILVGLAVLVKGFSYWFDQYAAGDRTLQPAVHRHLLHRRPCDRHRQDDLGHYRGNLCAAVLRQCRAAPLDGARLSGWSCCCCRPLCLGWSIQARCSTSASDPTSRTRNAATSGPTSTRRARRTAWTRWRSPTTRRRRRPPPVSCVADAEALPGIRLIDPNVVSPAYEQLQQVRGYYAFPKNLDVDRYTIDGKETDAVVAVREMDLSGVEDNWNNRKTVYTHGYGLVAAYGNRRQPGGEPEWIAKDIPPTGQIDEHEPRIYFGELQGQRPDQYSIVGAPAGTPPIELDTPGGGEGGNPKTYTYTGKGGVKIGSMWNRLLYAAKFADVNILLSDRVHPQSKIIYDRTPRQLVQGAAPWLKVDGDAYPAVVEGRIVWIVDGYTTSNSYPNSERVNLNEVTSDAQTSAGGTVVAQPQDDINYMRNSVKAVVDAYDGSVKLYAWDDTDPVLKAWSQAFPERRAAEVGDLPRPAGPPALPARLLQGAAADPGPLPHDQPGQLVPAVKLVGRPERPGVRRLGPDQGAAVLPVGEMARR